MSLKTNLIIVNYLNEYPLFGSKFLDYNNWKEILNLFIPKFKNSLPPMREQRAPRPPDPDAPASGGAGASGSGAGAGLII